MTYFIIKDRINRRDRREFVSKINGEKYTQKIKDAKLFKTKELAGNACGDNEHLGSFL